jgi:hypothetical protein
MVGRVEIAETWHPEDTGESDQNAGKVVHRLYSGIVSRYISDIRHVNRGSFIYMVCQESRLRGIAGG